MIKQYGYFSRSTGGRVECHVLFYWCRQENSLQNTNKLDKVKLKTLLNIRHGSLQCLGNSSGGVREVWKK